MHAGADCFSGVKSAAVPPIDSLGKQHVKTLKLRQPGLVYCRPVL